MPAIIAYLVIGSIFAVGLLADRVYGYRRFDPDSISDWVSRSIAATLVVVGWPAILFFCEYEE